MTFAFYLHFGAYAVPYHNNNDSKLLASHLLTLAHNWAPNHSPSQSNKYTKHSHSITVSYSDFLFVVVLVLLHNLFMLIWRVIFWLLLLCLYFDRVLCVSCELTMRLFFVFKRRSPFFSVVFTSGCRRTVQMITSSQSEHPKRAHIYRWCNVS